jgi:O-antigen ligase
MKKEKQKIPLYFILISGLIFITPVAYSLSLLEMDNIQKLLFFIFAFLILASSYFLKIEKNNLIVERLTLVLMMIYPLTFFTSFLNESSGSLLLSLSNLLPQISLVLLTIFVYSLIEENDFFGMAAFFSVIIASAFSLIGLLQIFDIEIVPLPAIILPGATLGHRGFAAEYLLPVLPYFIIAKNLVDKKYHPLLFIAAIINISFLLFTRSRAAFIFLFVGLIIYAVFVFSRKKLKNKFQNVSAIVLIILISFFISLIPSQIIERKDFQTTAASLTDTEFRSNKLRLTFWNASIKMILEEPITGFGTQRWSGTYGKYFGSEFNDQTINRIHHIHAHNDFLEIFSENGIASAVVFALIIFFVLRNIFLLKNDNENYFYIFLSALIVVLFSLISFPASKYSSYFYLAFAAGISIIRKSETNKINIKLSLPIFRLILLFFIAGGAVLSWIKISSELNYVDAMIAESRKDFKAMKSSLEKVNRTLYQLDATKQPVDYYRGIANYSLNNFDESLQNNLDALLLSPYNPLAMHNSASLFQFTGKKWQSIEAFENLKRFFPDYIDPQINLLMLYTETRQVNKAKRLFQELSEKDPENPRLKDFIQKLQYNSR